MQNRHPSLLELFCQPSTPSPLLTIWKWRKANNWGISLDYRTFFLAYFPPLFSNDKYISTKITITTRFFTSRFNVIYFPFSFSFRFSLPIPSTSSMPTDFISFFPCFIRGISLYYWYSNLLIPHPFILVCIYLYSGNFISCTGISLATIQSTLSSSHFRCRLL